MNDPRKNRVVLIGFRGSGKSTVGEKLAAMLEWKYVSTDRLIEEKEGMAINEIVEKNGWDHFRQLESDIMSQLQTSQNSVIDTGGGAVVEHDEVIANLLDSSMVVWLDTSLEDIIQRLKDDKNRPLLNRSNLIEDIKFNYKKRRPVYQSLAPHKFNTSVESADEICNKIISTLKSK